MNDHARIQRVCMLFKAVVLGACLVGAAAGVALLNHLTPQEP